MRSVLLELGVPFLLDGAEGGQKRFCLIVLTRLDGCFDLIESIGEFVKLCAVVGQKFLPISGGHRGCLAGLQSLGFGDVLFQRLQQARGILLFGWVADLQGEFLASPGEGLHLLLKRSVRVIGPNSWEK